MGSSTRKELTTRADIHSSCHWEMMFVEYLSRAAFMVGQTTILNHWAQEVGGRPPCKIVSAANENNTSRWSPSSILIAGIFPVFGRQNSVPRSRGSSRQCSFTRRMPIYAIVVEDEVTSNELVMNVRQSGQCSSTAKQPLHTHACLHGSSARSTADD